MQTLLTYGITTIFGCILLGLSSTAQQLSIDTNNVRRLDTMAMQALPTNETIANEYAETGIAMAQQLNFLSGLASLHRTKGNIFASRSKFRDALAQFNLSLTFASKAKLPIAIAKVNNNLCNVYREIGDHDKAVKHIQEAIDIYEEKNMPIELAATIQNLALVYFSNKQYDMALQEGQQALLLAQQNKDAATIAVIVGNIATYFERKANETQKNQYIDSAFFYQRQQLLYTQQLGIVSKITPAIVASAWGNLAGLHRINQQYDSAAIYFQHCIDSCRKYNLQSILCLKLADLASCYLQQQKTTQAKSPLQEAASLANTLGMLEQMTVAEQMKTLMEQSGNFKEALRYHQQFAALNDSLYNIEQLKIMNNLQVRYETQKKEAQIVQLEKDKATQQKINYLLAALAIAALALLAFVWQRAQLKKKLFAAATKHKQQQIEKLALENELSQKEKMQTQTKLELEQSRKAQLEQEIDFRYRELIANTLQLEKKNELIIALKAQLQLVEKQHQDIAAALKPAYKTLNESISIDDDFEKFSLHFQQVHPNFFAKMKVLSEGSLTQTDLRYCAYMKMNLGNKEIANLLNITPESFRVTRHRIKQKLKLEKTIDLQDFIAAC
jgi:tetratricopeptide (TPR) repeat protein/DNA-binding CsgD family transcriptional regulator